MADVKVIIIVILLLVSIAFLIWALITQSKYDSRAANVVQNPYCLRVGCANGHLPLAYELTAENDPQRTAYQTFNWCVVNAPPTQMVRVFQACATGSNVFQPDSDEYKLLDAFINWYPSQYMPTCGNSFKDQPVTVADGSAPDTSLGPNGKLPVSPLAQPDDNSNPYSINSPCNQNGPNDDAGFYAYACASRYPALQSTAGYEQLAAIFGPLVNCYGF